MFSIFKKSKPAIDYSKFDSEFPKSYGFTYHKYRYKDGYRLGIDSNISFVIEKTLSNYYFIELEVVLPLREILIDESKLKSDIEILTGKKFEKNVYFITKTHTISGGVKVYVKFDSIDISVREGKRNGCDNFLKYLSLKDDIKNIIYNNISVSETFSIDTVVDQFLGIKETYDLEIGYERTVISYRVDLQNVKNLDVKLQILDRISKMYNIIKDDVNNIEVTSKDTSMYIDIYPKLKSYVAV
jgi:hypothetical protein